MSGQQQSKTRRKRALRTKPKRVQLAHELDVSSQLLGGGSMRLRRAIDTLDVDEQLFQIQRLQVEVGRFKNHLKHLAQEVKGTD